MRTVVARENVKIRTASGTSQPPEKKTELAAMNRIAFLILLVACTETSCNTATDEVQARPKFLALGDSYTIGESVAPQLRWPNQLTDSLEALGTVMEPATIVATTGWTTSDLQSGMDAADIHETNWDLVSLLIGVNNQYQGLPIDAYAVEFEALMDEAIALAGGRADRVFVVSIPDYGYTPFGEANQATISASLAAFNDTCRTRTLQRGLSHFDITGISQQWPDVEGLVASDGLHPSGLQYGLWVSSFVRQVEAKLND